MARVHYFVLSDEQAAVLTALGIHFDNLGGLPCVTDWQSVIDQVDAIVWADDELSEVEEGYLDAMSAQVISMYWSTEAHSWFPA